MLFLLLSGCYDSLMNGLFNFKYSLPQIKCTTSLLHLHRDPWTGGSANAAARALLATGAACHVLLLGSENTEALTGPAAVKRAVSNILNKKVSI